MVNRPLSHGSAIKRLDLDGDGQEMRKLFRGRTLPLLAATFALTGAVIPAIAQDGSANDRLRRLEAEVRDLKRQAGGDRTVAPQSTPTMSPPRLAGSPATTPIADLLARMEAIETQLARLTAQNEESGHKLRQLEERVAANDANREGTAGATASGPDAADRVAQSSGVAASGSALTPTSGSAIPARPGVASAASATPARASTTDAAAAPAAQRVAAVRAIVKPQTSDPGDDEYSYGFRLWDAKFYPEAQQQLKLFLDKYPRHSRVSFARNLMGRALLDDGKPREAAAWFLQNYQANKQGDRAPDSLLFLAQAMNELKDTSRACIALAEFTDTYPQEATGRLSSQYDTLRRSVKCD
jgi:TolA-binding protein